MDYPHLSEQRLRFFDTFGYLKFDGLFAGRIDEIVRAFEAVWEEHGGGHNGRPHEGVARSCVFPFIDQHEALCALLDVPFLIGAATSLLGHDFNYMGSDGNYYTGDTAWHSDGWHESIAHIKLAFYLDPVRKDSGCLRVIPGSHRLDEPYAQRLHNEIGQCEALWGINGRDVPAVALESEPGDVLCFNHNLKHASFGGGSRRRMFTINLCQRYPGERLRELRDYIGGHARFWLESNYGEKMLCTASAERMRHLEQVLANQAHLPELSRQARARMSEPSRG